MTVSRVTLVVAVLVALLPLLGLWVAAFDSLGIVAPYVCLGLLAVAQVGRRMGRAWRGLALFAGLVGLVPALTSLGPARAAPEGAVVRLLQHNIHYMNEAAALAARLEAYDIATLQEVHVARRALSGLPADWFVATCPRPREVSAAVVSRLPVLASGCLTEGEPWVQVETPRGPLTVVSVHLFWPWPYRNDRQFAQVTRLATEIAALPRPVAVGGDFNQMPWSGTMARLEQASGSGVLPGLRATFLMAGGAVRLPIDHLLLPEGWPATATVGDLSGSDHHSVSVEIGMEP